MPWINAKKAFHKVAQSWILHFLKMYKIPNEIIKFIENTMKNWTVELTTEGKSFAEVKIQWGKFQREELSLWLF